MGETVRIHAETLESEVGPRPYRAATSPISIDVVVDGDTDVVKIAGELDIANVAWVTSRCTEGQTRHVVIDLSDLMFLDCGGCRALVNARAALKRQQRTLDIVGARGEPYRLLDLVRQFVT